MNLNKRECRKYADPGLKMRRNSGLFCVKQVKYMIRTAIKNIAGQRVLLLYVYSKKSVAAGDLAPLWTVFQSRDAYITLARREDGTTSWRTATFDNLCPNYYFRCECAFYSLGDERRAIRFCKSEEDGLQSLARFQSAIREKKLRKRHCAQEIKIVERMEGLAPLPRKLKGWIQRDLAPCYLFYDYKRGQKSVPAFCSCCGHTVVIAGAKHNAEKICPHCKHKATMKSRGRRGNIADRGTCQVLQKINPNEIVIRIIKFYYEYKKTDVPKKYIDENARLFIRHAGDEQLLCDSYYFSHVGGMLTNWKNGTRPTFFMGNENFSADLCGHLYCENLPDELMETPWRYCPLRQFYECKHEEMEVAPFLSTYGRCPKLEHLVKVGFYRLAGDLAYRYVSADILDETQNRTHRLLRVAAEDLPFLRSIDVNSELLECFHMYYKSGIKERQTLLLWQIEHNLCREQHIILEILTRTTPHKMMRYIDEQHALLADLRTSYGMARYQDMSSILSEYHDYLDMCKGQHYDMANSFVLFPANLQKAHDKVAHSIKLKADAKKRRAFKAVYRRLGQSLDYEQDGIKTVFPKVPEDLIEEGNALHHCVGGYVGRVADKSCVIVFLRSVKDPQKPFYTVEVNDREIVQIRGMGNGAATPEVKAFVQHWKNEVLNKPASLTDAA